MEVTELTTDQIEQELIRFEQVRRQATSVMTALIAEADRRQVPTADGCRTTAEWASGRLDLESEETSMLVTLSRRLPDLPETAHKLARGEVGPVRAALVSRVANEHTESEWWDRVAPYHLAGVRRQVARRRRISARHERRTHESSYLSIQPNLDESWWRIAGGLDALAGQIVSDAIRTRAEDLPADAGSMPHRQALALEQICSGNYDEGDSTGPSITAFLDLDLADGTGGEMGAELAFGPRVGPNALAELLCNGSVTVVGLDNGRPVVTSNRASTIPPAVRAAVLWRDGGCRAPGCRSRYRLQPHHVIPRSHNPIHTIDNLITLCWFHHHVVVHRRGMVIERQADGSIRFVAPADCRSPP